MKSAAFFEILIFAFIAFVLIKKLIDTLGQTDDDRPTNFGSFANRMKIKNVEEVIKNQGLSKSSQQKLMQLLKKFSGNEQNYDSLLVELEDIDKARILNTIAELKSIDENFKLEKFLQGAQKAHAMLLDAFAEKKMPVIEFLTTKDFTKSLLEEPSSSVEHNMPSSQAKISDVSKFGNSAFIKVVFVMDEDCKEEWVFTKNITNQAEKAWKISNITPA